MILKEALKNAESLIGDRSINFIAKQVIIEMVFQLGIGGVSKFKKMWSYQALDNEDYGEASFQMMDSLWAKQTPNRAEKLSQRKNESAKQGIMWLNIAAKLVPGMINNSMSIAKIEEKLKN